MTIVALFIIFAAIIGTGASVATVAYLLSRIRQLESGDRGAQPAALNEQVNRLREELLTVQEELSNVTERLDFTEKLLMSGSDDSRENG